MQNGFLFSLRRKFIHLFTMKRVIVLAIILIGIFTIPLISSSNGRFFFQKIKFPNSTLKDSLKKDRIKKWEYLKKIGKKLTKITYIKGKLEIDNENYFALSPVSPLAKQMLGLKGGSEFEFNRNKFRIQEIN